VLIGIEIGETHIIRHPVGEILKKRGGGGRCGCIHGDDLQKIHAVTAQLSNCGKGLRWWPTAILWLSSQQSLG
jgi:hypothetical protein